MTILSCSKLKQFLCLADPLLINVHGPCAAIVHQIIDLDMAVCLACDFWPSSETKT